MAQNRLTILMPEETFWQLSAMAAAERRTARDQVLYLIDRYVADYTADHALPDKQAAAA